MPSGRLAGAELNPLLASPFVRGEVGGTATSLLSPLARLGGLNAIYTHRVQDIRCGNRGRV